MVIRLITRLMLLIVLMNTGGFGQSQEKYYSGALHLDYRNVENNAMNPGKINLLPESKKSPVVGGLLSLVFPGAGEFYSESYVKAGIFAAIEVSVITVALLYDKKGDDQTKSFQKVADARWSVVKYAEWLNRFQGANIPIDPNISLPHWQRVNWDSLNRAEAGFSHKLPAYGEQQYYELIGKYHQFSSGWDDFDPNNANKEDLPAIFLEYAVMRGKANDYYNISTKALLGLYINHFLSTLDGFWSTVSYNKNLQASVRIDPEQFSYEYRLIPRVNLKYYF